MTNSILKINVSNIIKNYKAIKAYVGEQVNVAAMAKCNCYGLGMKRIIPEIFKEGCEEFYVANINEAITLRKLLEKAKIYVLNGVERGEEKKFLNLKLIPVLNNLHQLKIWTRIARDCGRKLKCSLHIDSGMTRTGIDSYLVKTALDNISENRCLEVCYILSHLACADDVGNKMNERQLAMMQSLKRQYPNFKYSFSNSAGIFLGKEYYFDQVRPGIIIYGGTPYDLNTRDIPISLLPVINLVSKIIDIHIIKDTAIQKSIGYSATYKLKPGMVTATIPIGYGDGYPRSLSNKGHCYINGIKVNIIGKISMDLICLDISKVPKQFQKIGQKVEVIGDHISIEEIASLANTTNYEILTSLSDRYKIKYEIETIT